MHRSSARKAIRTCILAIAECQPWLPPSKGGTSPEPRPTKLLPRVGVWEAAKSGALERTKWGFGKDKGGCRLFIFSGEPQK